MGAMMDRNLVEHALELADRHFPAAPRGTTIVREGPRAWFVVQTRTGGEDDARDALGEAGYETYLPTMRKDVWSARKHVVITRTFKLFHRYLFAELPAINPFAATRTVEDIDAILGMGGRPTPIAAGEVRRFMDAEAAQLFDDTERARAGGRRKRDAIRAMFKPGSRIRAKGGPFGGFSGLVTDVHGRGAVEAMIEIFGSLVPVEFPIEMVEPA